MLWCRPIANLVAESELTNYSKCLWGAGSDPSGNLPVGVVCLIWWLVAGYVYRPACPTASLPGDVLLCSGAQSQYQSQSAAVHGVRYSPGVGLELGARRWRTVVDAVEGIS